MTILLIIGGFILFSFFFGWDEDNPSKNTLEDKVKRISRGPEEISDSMETKRTVTVMQLTKDTRMQFFTERVMLEAADREAEAALRIINLSKDLTKDEARAELKKDCEEMLNKYFYDEKPEPVITFSFTPIPRPIAPNPELQKLVDEIYDHEKKLLDAEYQRLEAKAEKNNDYAIELNIILREKGFPNHKIQRIIPILPSIRMPRSQLKSLDHTKTDDPGSRLFQEWLDQDREKTRHRKPQFKLDELLRPDKQSINLAQAVKNNSNSPMRIGPVTASYTEPFTSKAGKKHLRVVLQDHSLSVDGIIWESHWTEEQYNQMKLKKPFHINAKVSEYQGKTSLTIDQVELSDT